MVMFGCARTEKRNYWYLLLALGTFFVAMEEISWGQRLLHLRTPELLRSINLQNEITIHNIRAIAPESKTVLVVSAAFVVYGFMLPVLNTASFRVRMLIERVNLPLPPLYLAPIFLVTACFLTFSVIGTQTAGLLVNPMTKSDEIGELLMGISLGSFAVDECFRKLQWRKRKKRTSVLLIGGIVMLPALWVAWEISAWLGFTAILLFAILLLAFLIYRLEIEVPERNRGWTVGTAIASFYIATFAIALLFTEFAGAESAFIKRLNQLAGTRLPALGQYTQSEKIFAYLEKHPEHADEDLLLNKGRLLVLMGRKKEATMVFRAALTVELERHAELPEDVGVLRRLGLIYSSLGNYELNEKYFNAALRTYMDAINTDDSPDRTAWLYIGRAQVYTDMGRYDQAIEEYLRASRLANSGEQGDLIRSAIRRLLLDCSREKRRHRSLDWEQVERMSEKLNDSKNTTHWCS